MPQPEPRRCRCCGGPRERPSRFGHFCSADCQETGPDYAPEEIERRLAAAAALRKRNRPTLSPEDVWHRRGAPAPVVSPVTSPRGAHGSHAHWRKYGISRGEVVSRLFPA